MSAAQSCGDVVTGGVDLDHVPLASRKPRALYLPDPERRRRRRADQPRARVGGGHRRVRRCAGRRGPHRAARPGAARPGRRRCASWCRGWPGRGGRRGREVGDDVAAAERVDRLLGVADQHHRGVTGEGAVEHLPLLGVGVLELVDQHDPPALAHPLAGRCVVARRVRRRAGRGGRRTTGSRGAACAGRPRAHLVGERDPLPAVGLGSPAGASAACASPTTVRGQSSARWRARTAARGRARRSGGGRRRRRPRSTRSSSDSTKVAPVSVSPATPSERSTVWQNWWVVAIVAESNDASASRSRRCRRATSASSASSSVATTGWSRSAPAGSASARSACTSCSRTRSRSSWLAARPKVITSSWSSVAAPSAT